MQIAVAYLDSSCYYTSFEVTFLHLMLSMIGSNLHKLLHRIVNIFGFWILKYRNVPNLHYVHSVAQEKIAGRR